MAGRGIANIPLVEPSKFLKPLMISIALLVAGNAAADCDNALKKFRTNHLDGHSLCEIQNRYKTSKEKLKQAGVKNPERIGNIFATRFINKRDWITHLSSSGDSEFAAWRVYQPAPTTWGNWAQAAEMVLSGQTKNIFKNGSVVDINNWILTLHKIEMNSLLPVERVGVFRTDVAEIIPLHFIDNAYTAADIMSIRRNSFVSPKTGEKLMNFALRVCEDLDTSAGGFYFQMGSHGPMKACGDLTLAHHEEVLAQMNLWSAYVKEGLQTLEKSPGRLDIIELAAMAQQWFTAIHGFIDGNGRTSRLVMDFIFNQYGLPAPILDDMEQDFFQSPHGWADQVGRGLLNSVTALEACVKNKSINGCTEVSAFPPLGE